MPQFDRLVSALGGVARLRELILTLAVRGKLVPQDPDDEPAGVLLQRIHAEKGRLVAEGKVKREKALPTIENKDKPYGLPQGWEFARLGHLIHSIKSGGTPSKQNPDFWDGDIPWASVKDLGVGTPVIETQDHITQAGLDAGSCLAAAGSILICTRMGLGKIGEALVDVAINQDLKAIALAPLIDKKYFINFFKTLAIVGSGMTVAGIKQDELLGFVVPVPPCAEQTRIVARVDELMRLCDALEAKGRLEAEQHARLLGSLLGTLPDSSTPEEMAANWQRVANHFDLLLDRPEAVDALEQTILQLALRGLLVPQDAAEEPAIEPLSRLKAQRPKEEREPRTRQADSSDAGASEHAPFALPDGWVWAKAQDLTSPSTIITYGVLKPEWVEVGVPTIRVQDIQDGNLRTEQVAQCSSARAEKFARTKLSEGDLLIAKDGATLGKTAFVPKALEGGNITQHVLRFSIASTLNRDYVRLVIDSPHGQAWMRGETQGVALPGVNVGDFRRMPIPVPPVREQARIVARFTELRRLSANLRQRLDRSGATQAALADALIDQALAT